ncbi:TPA: transketolase [Candidatus Uhrbacteria bacterium]|nr:transketolase [Candidatus Uhrbacteria bacterium]HCU32169.1 transketolase [Candidatus Uhrbacteria bacterium]
MHDGKFKSLEEIAVQIREDILKMLIKAGSGHSAGSLGLADIFTAFYFHILNHNPKKPNWKNRDRLILSNGHVCPARYAAMAHAGYFPKSELLTLRKLGSRLQGHPELQCLPGVESTSGPLGEGSSQAAGLAYAAKMDEAKWRVYCLMSDGELQEGQTWEALMFAAKYKLTNCTFIIDRNNIQIEGHTETVMPLEPLVEKFKAFGLHVEECAGNDIRDFVNAIERAKEISEKPTVIVAHTIPGKGIDFMENKFEWHGKIPVGAEGRKALAEIRTLQGKIKSEHE